MGLEFNETPRICQFVPRTFEAFPRIRRTSSNNKNESHLYSAFIIIANGSVDFMCAAAAAAAAVMREQLYTAFPQYATFTSARHNGTIGSQWDRRPV